MNKKPHITQRESLNGCINTVCGIRTEESLELRLSLIGKDEQAAPAPLRTRAGNTFYLEVSQCPYGQCPNALASMTTERPHVGQVIALCASKQVAAVYLNLLNDTSGSYVN